MTLPDTFDDDRDPWVAIERDTDALGVALIEVFRAREAGDHARERAALRAYDRIALAPVGALR